MTKIAIITSVYNGEEFISQTIRSVIKNNSKYFDYFILNNGSTDNTKKIINKFKKTQNIKLYENKSVRSRADALNQIITLVKENYKFYTVVDADDIISNDWILQARTFMLQNKSVVALCGQFALIDKAGNIYRKSHIPIFPNCINKYFSFTFPIVHSGLIIRTSAIKRNKVYDEKLNFGQDWELCIYLAKKGKVVAVEHFSVYFRHHDQSLTKKSVNLMQSRLDKIKNLRKARTLTKSPILILKNKNREASEILALAYLNLKDKNYYKSINYFMISLFTFPFALLLNNYIISIFKKDRIFTSKVR